MKQRPLLRRFGIFAAILFAGLAVLAAANWQALALGLAVASAETRSALLREADWDMPETARAFRQRFAPGVPEVELLAWLDQNDFSVARADHRASRRIRSLPCNELATIDWTTDANGRITRADATVAEAGCL